MLVFLYKGLNNILQGGTSEMMDTPCSWLCASLMLLVMTVFGSNSVLAAQEHDQKIVVGIISRQSLTSERTQRINATWWSELQQPVRTKSGSRVKVDLAFINKPTLTTLSNAKHVSQLLRQESISLLVGPDDLIVRLASSDQQTPLIAISSGIREEALERDGGDDGSEDESLPSAALTLHLMPANEVFHRAVVDFARFHKWENVAVIYDSTEGLELIGLLMGETDVTTRAWRVKSRANETVLRDQLLRVRFLEMRHIVVVCEPEVIQRLLRAALRLSMLSLRYFWVFVHPLPTYISYEPFMYTGVNLIMFSPFTEDALKTIKSTEHQMTTQDDYEMTRPDDLQMTTPDDHQMTTLDDNQKTRPEEQLVHALTDDSLRMLTMALKTMNSTAESADNCLTDENSEQADCIQNRSIDILQLIDFMRQGSFEGLTGKIQFDATGRRTSTVLRVLGLNASYLDGTGMGQTKGLIEIGKWTEDGSSSAQRLLIQNNPDRSPLLSTRPLQTLNRVVTLVDPPFVMLKKNYEQLTGNERFEGFLIDLFDKIAERLKFKYELYESPDGNYGSKDKSGNWNGMIRELIDGNAKMCLGAISITSDREGVVDFSKPFKQKMFNFLMKKPEEISTVFQFLYPLSTAVWLAILSALVLVSILLFLLDRARPNFPDHRAGDSDARFGLVESIWFMYGALVGGGTEGWTPRTASCRLLTSAWWFFGLIIISSYTANLAAFLTVTRIETPIKSISDLVAQKQIKYGTVRNTYAMSMFQNSQLDILKQMWQSMSFIHPDSLVNNTKQGIEKAQEGDYAFIWDAPINKFIAMQDCTVIATGDPFDEKGYGIGVPMGASYRDDLTMAILSLGETGEIVKMEGRWWSNGVCPDFAETSTGSNEELNMFNVAGVFLLLAFGAILASVVCLVQYLSTRIAASKTSWRHGNSSHKVQDQKMSPLADPETII